MENPNPIETLGWCAYEIAADKWGENIARMASQLEEQGYGWHGRGDLDTVPRHVRFADFCTILAMYSVREPGDDSADRAAQPLHSVIKDKVVEMKDEGRTQSATQSATSD